MCPLSALGVVIPALGQIDLSVKRPGVIRVDVMDRDNSLAANPPCQDAIILRSDADCPIPLVETGGVVRHQHALAHLVSVISQYKAGLTSRPPF